MNQDNSLLGKLCYPYFFALKEGNEIQKNKIDYSLLLLQRQCIEVVESPKRSSSSKKGRTHE